jgi:hypothetical protein
MYSVYGDTVLDPFWGTGTTTLASMVAGRNSVGYELEDEFVEVFDDRCGEVPALAAEVIQTRLDAHQEFVTERQENGDDLGYEAEHYDFPVRTKQESELKFYAVDEVEARDERYVASHEPVESVDDV